MSKPTPLSGFPELLPEERFVEQQVIDTLRRTFELHGFAGIETRAAEPLDQLLRKGETSKEVYVLRRLQAEADGSDSGIGLHFDLTVPFARYVLENAGKLEFPFRRYQIQKAWRGERPQEGRYREFTQADIDVVMKDELPFHFDVEVARVIAEALSGLPLPPMRLRVNNRKLIEGFYRGIGAPDPAAVITIIDKLDKMPADQVSAMLVDDAGLTEQQAAQCLELATISSNDTSFVDAVRALGVKHELLDIGLAELEAVIDGCARLRSDRFEVEANLSLARGLDYYTGTVFEIYMVGFEFLKSVGGGGRYDALASDGRNTYPGVGISLRHLAHARAPDQPGAAARGPQGAVRRTRGPRRRGVPRRQRLHRRLACGPATSRARSPRAPRSSASRSGTPSAAASRSSGSPPPRAATR